MVHRRSSMRTRASKGKGDERKALQEKYPYSKIIRLKTAGLFEDKNTGRKVYFGKGDLLPEGVWIRVKAQKGKKVRPGRYRKRT